MIAWASLFLASATGSSCLELQVARSVGQPVSASYAKAVPCPAKPLQKAIRYDQSTGANVALIPLQAGDVIKGVSLAAAPTFQKGQQLALSSRVGSVVIERPVTALQGARPGDRQIFVKTNDGDIFAAPIKIEAADE